MEQLHRYAGALLALTLCAGAAAHESAPPPRAIAVSGEGEVSARPDRARLSLAVEKLDPELRKAEAEVNRIVRAYLTEAKALGAQDKHVSTTGVGIQPEYAWPEGGRERKFTGYRVTRQIEVKIENLDKLGDFVLRATQVGVNQVNAPALESSRARDLERQALVQAAEDARAKARALADTLGVKLGVVSRITESSVGAPPVLYKAMAMRAEAADGNTQMGMSLSEVIYRATVTAEFGLLPP